MDLVCWFCFFLVYLCKERDAKGVRKGDNKEPPSLAAEYTCEKADTYEEEEEKKEGERIVGGIDDRKAEGEDGTSKSKPVPATMARDMGVRRVFGVARGSFGVPGVAENRGTIGGGRRRVVRGVMPSVGRRGVIPSVGRRGVMPLATGRPVGRRGVAPIKGDGGGISHASFKEEDQ